ncbi:MAG: MarR family transcriptional regulator [Victivallaceae bacterium]|nr:MarR family transcriptional regulator [Victivallaceae bacterium]
MKKLTLDIYQISRYTHRFYARELRRLGVSMGQFPFLMGIDECDGISQEKLSTQLGIGKSTTTAMIRQLIQLELVTREVDAEDRRNFRLHVTEKGRALVPRIQDVVERCHKLITGELSEIERMVFCDLSKKVRIAAETKLGAKRKKRAL